MHNNFPPRAPRSMFVFCCAHCCAKKLTTTAALLSTALTVTMFKKIANWFEARGESRKLENWFSVTWDDEYIYRNVSPPGKDAWSDQFRWADIERICFEATDYRYSDDIYFFTAERSESYVIPTEAKDGAELWGLVIEKNLFDAELAVKAATSPKGMFCWPPSTS